MTISPWKAHVRRWTNCTRCQLCAVRKHVVLARGTLPCQILLVGEAPGASEDVLGQPFIGPAGHLLDRMISDAGWNVSDHDVRPVRYAFTNLVGCIPRSEETHEKVGEPPKESIEECAPRLREIVGIAQPELIICVGELAKKWVPKLLESGDAHRADRKAVGTKAGLGASRRVGPTQRSLVVENVRNLHPVPRITSITHPAAILRADISQRGLVIQRTIVSLRDALEELS